MKEAFEKIKERLKEARKECVKLQKTTEDAYGYMKQKHGIDVALSIVSEVEAEYINKSTEYINKSEDCSTNADRIRSMSDEELAWFLCGVFDEESAKFICGETIPHYDEDKIAEWLKSPTTD